MGCKCKKLEVWQNNLHNVETSFANHTHKTGLGFFFKLAVQHYNNSGQNMTTYATHFTSVSEVFGFDDDLLYKPQIFLRILTAAS